VRLIHWLTALLAAALPWCAQGAPFPERDKTLRIVVPFAAGGGVDAAARLLGTQLQKQTGLTVVVENKAGGSGTIGGKAVQTAAADGYTLLFSAATHVLARQVLAQPPYDPQTDFLPVARTGNAPLMLVLGPSKPQARLGELIGAMKQQPDKWTAGIPAAGAPSHLATLMLAKQAQVRFATVPYKGTQPALMDVAGGHTDLLLDSMISLLPMAKAGKVRPIAVTSARRSAVAPDIPTFKESGLPDFAYDSWYGVWAPKGTPPDRVAALNAAINAATQELARSGALAQLGIEPVTESVDQFRQYIAAEVAEGTELLKAAGFRPD
jgi:tripartite-type tricarboxylate transporter receptor subunit TctC